MKVVHQIPEYGRWDDLMFLWPKVLQLHCPGDTRTQREWVNHINKNFGVSIRNYQDLIKIQIYQRDIVRITGKQLKIDLKSMHEGGPITLCCKWAPTEKDFLDCSYRTITTLCKEMGWSRAQYRKNYTSPLREYLQLLERLMCEKRWSEINFNKVPSQAMQRLKKAFMKNTPSTFMAWRLTLSTGETRVNAKQLMPHELIQEISTLGYSDPVVEAQWKILEDQSLKLGNLADSVVVVDTSSSMLKWHRIQRKNNFTPLDVAIGLGLLIANTVQGPFHNRIITFSDKPTYVTLHDGSIFDRYHHLLDAAWAGTTNLEATFDLILSRAKKFNLTDAKIPKRVFILTDLGFNKADVPDVNDCNTRDSERTNFKVIDRKYKDAGYTRPQLIFWDVCGAGKDFAVSVGVAGTAMVSGFYPSIMKAVIGGEKLDCWGIVKNVLQSERYRPLYELLNTT